MSEKTEQPTAKKLRDARQRGEVAKSRDFTQTALIVALFGYLIGNGNQLAQALASLLLMPFPFIGADFAQSSADLIYDSVIAGITVLLPFLGIVLVVGIFAEAIQTGLVFAFEAIKPSGKKLNVVENAKNMFSKKNWVELLKSILKIGILGWLVYFLVRDSLGILMYMPGESIEDLGSTVWALLRQMLLFMTVAYVVLSMADLVWQRKQYTKNLMMSKDEVKQEYKTMEGNPEIKGQRKQLHQEMLSEGAVQRSRTASVLVTNPTHLAIAILYEDERTPLPMVTAKGEGALAERMIAAAREAGVPVMQNIPLAHALFDEAAVDQYIPSDLIEPVAAVLRRVREIAQGSTEPQWPS
jgi:type III secretion protein U